MWRITTTSAWLSFPVACGIVLGYQSLTAMPFLVGAMQDSLGFTTQQIGLITGLEITAMAIVVLGLAPAINKMPRHYVAFGATLALGLAQLLSAFVSDLFAFGALRFLAGLCGGTVAAIMSATISLSPQPERISGLAMSGAAFTDLLLFVGLSWAIAQAGATGAYLLLALMSLCLAPSLLLFPARSAPTPPLTRKVVRAGLLVLIAVPCFAAGQTAIWAYVERMATALAFPVSNIAVLLGIGSLVGMTGSLLASQLGTRYGSTLPLVLGSVLLVLFGALTAITTSQWVFIVAYFAFVFFYLFKEPYLFGIAARLDTQGRILAGVAGTALLGAGLGTAMAGQALQMTQGTQGYGVLAWVLAIFVGAGLALILPLAIRANARD